MRRCFWCNEKNPLYIRYHDEEWGVVRLDDGYLFEMLLLESFQAGLSWECVLNKREAFRLAFDLFDPQKIAHYDGEKCDSLAQNKDIIRNRRKIVATVKNASVFLDIVSAYGSFHGYLLQFWDGQVLKECGCIRSPLSDAISKDLYRRGMRFVGSVIIYSFLQAIGVIRSHERGCFLYEGA